ncbi:hypothetical protein TEA_024931 [Camellia sinensis var. sinensis]|uniref:Fe2OG dioxygenase domain-containing protein n=1 Tax=Camellia sinensis var. sinensis TaxID=542762 RepID=A0A4V3WQZ7_CAMSN|nr:hypothetical protein TEA_024931 [Camellia sinensis var. sinensis]
MHRDYHALVEVAAHVETVIDSVGQDEEEESISTSSTIWRGSRPSKAGVVSHECLVERQGCVLFWTLSLKDRGLVVGSYGNRSWLACNHLGNCSRKYRNLISLEMETLTNEALEAPRDFKNFSALNCIDLSSPDILNFVSLLKQACLDSGFFYVINHGISQEFMDEVFYQSKSFFDLPFYIYDIVHMIVYMRASEVAKAISRIIALAINLEVDFFDRQEMLGKPIATLRLLHYDGRVSDPMKGICGAGAHSDFGLITLLATDDVYGLQICKDKDAKPQKWEFVAPLKGAFIVNLGDMLERWSNCIFRLHTLWSLVTIVFLNACPPASRKRTLPSFLLSNVKLTCSNGTRILILFSSHTKHDSPNSVVNIAGIFASRVEHRG